MIAGETPVLVDFYATWCGPCRVVSEQVLPYISKRFGDSLRLVKINSDTYPNLCDKFKVMAFPTLILFKGGQVIHVFEGLPPGSIKDFGDQIEYFMSSK